MDLNFFSGMDRKTFEKGLKPVQKGYIPTKNDILIVQYALKQDRFGTNYHNQIFYFFTDFEDGTTEQGWGVFYDIYNAYFSDTDILVLTKRVGGHAYQFPNTYEDWIWKYSIPTYIWNDNKNFYLNWNENPLEVKQ